MAPGPLRLARALALVTGGGSGIGRAVCSRLAREGASVAVADLHEAGAQGTLRGLPAGDHQAWTLDVGSAGSVAALMAHIQTHFSRPPNVCVNCAGITMDEFLLRQKEEAFDAVLRVNLKGTFLVTQAVARALVESGGSGGGSIINMGSIVGKVGNLGQVNYAASKAGVEALSKTAAKELARYGIRCNTVLPGFIRSPMTDTVPQKVLDKFAAMVPLGRLGDPEDVADVCAFLASEESRYITGASIEVTGGLFI
ncbi:(3R)-3-hydroxyacyl-CoA dehydrogenase isoform X2 [Anolis carolinensis]|uniref:(3R)-3-hydroxyacyl-CoA dehydrogenase isoform X2 n=1 Tax=Anolis carolinensis TaxID=28377 RepID=UPI0007DB6EDB|nr:PREDICTED: estradiol 17-beta-dehydrogenase 8 [Anolis carolinensis]|eukprot:XP_008122613.2 PREDICTED: estradiol 17-beta-dehydrogenase 8 [Anolis carolinensis]